MHAKSSHYLGTSRAAPGSRGESYRTAKLPEKSTDSRAGDFYATLFGVREQDAGQVTIRRFVHRESKLTKTTDSEESHGSDVVLTTRRGNKDENYGSKAGSMLHPSVDACESQRQVKYITFLTCVTGPIFRTSVDFLMGAP